MTTPRGSEPSDEDIGLILASGSPRRRAFMELLGLSFEIEVADVDERHHPGERPAELVARLSRAKAQAVAARHPQATVIGADTVVTLADEILGKPVTPEEAAAMLRLLRDRVHQVYSGICVYPGSGMYGHPEYGRTAPTVLGRLRPDSIGGGPEVVVVESTVWMRAYTDDEIAAYVASGSPLDKAGAYGIQDAPFNPVARLDGCYAAVMGLPLCHLAQMLYGQYGRYGRYGRTAVRPYVRPYLRAAPSVPDVPALCSAATGVSCCGGKSAEWNLESRAP